MNSAVLVPRVEQACQDLLRAGQAVTFAEVGQRTGLGRATLYRRPELRAVVEEHRRRSHDALTLTGLAVEVDQLRRGMEALAARVRTHEEAIRRLARSGPRSS
jgi:hypothetical protein